IEWLAPLMAFLMPLIGWVAVEALTEKTVALPAIYAPFARRGFLARGLGRILYPGWATAILFLMLVLGLITLAFEFVPYRTIPQPPDQLDPRMLWPIYFFALISPLPLMIFFPRVKQRFWLYVLIQLVFGLLYAAANIASDSPLGRNPGALLWLAPIPSASLMALVSHQDDPSVFMFLTKVTTGCGLVVLTFMAFYILREFRVISRLERVALEEKPNVE
ncbi:MAG: hypothetical protein K8R87_13600, partial [Verrucomicrobia bacterium]|nr:hypothetical protein [Verrucomicrobiota bacterium]